MKLGQLKYFLLLSVLFLVGCEEAPVNWFPSFDSKDTIPFGTYVLRQELPALFPDSNITNIDQPTDEFFEEIQYEYRHDHYIYLNENVQFDSLTWSKILQYVNQGGAAFIALPNVHSTLESTLGVSTTTVGSELSNSPTEFSIKVDNQEKKFIFEDKVNNAYFTKMDTETTDILGYRTYQGDKQPNFIKVYYGDGFFLMHTNPYVFTNYQMLKKNQSEYVADIFSYFNSADILWDNHRMGWRGSGTRSDGGFFNALSFILKHDGLRTAFLLLMMMGVLYLVFNSKRRQRAVTIVLPYKNYTLDFAKTLSELYRYNPDHTALVKYKINYFLEQLKQHYNLTTKEMEKDFAQILSARSAVPYELCNKLVVTINLFRNKNYLDKEDFFKLQSLIEQFNQKTSEYGRRTSPN